MPTSPMKSFGKVALIAGGALLAGLWMSYLMRPDASGFRRGGLAVGAPAPPIQAAGWINGEGPKAESLQGKVVVVDAWAHWCGPCLRKAPELVATYEKFKSRGVIFLGLTSDGASDIPEMQRFLAAAKFTWPCGYGALESLGAFQADFIPAAWVIDKSGKIAWNFDSHTSIDAAIEQAVAAAESR